MTGRSPSPRRSWIEIGWRRCRLPTGWIHGWPVAAITERGTGPGSGSGWASRSSSWSRPQPWWRCAAARREAPAQRCDECAPPTSMTRLVDYHGGQGLRDDGEVHSSRALPLRGLAASSRHGTSGYSSMQGPRGAVPAVWKASLKTRGIPVRRGPISRSRQLERPCGARAVPYTYDVARTKPGLPPHSAAQ